MASVLTSLLAGSRVERRKDPPFAGYGPNTGGPAYFWQDEHGHGAWVDGRPPVPCGQWFEAPA